MRQALFSNTVPFIALLLLPLLVAALICLCTGLTGAWMEENSGRGEEGLVIPDLGAQRWPPR
jgi:hypothetical protein